MNLRQTKRRGRSLAILWLLGTALGWAHDPYLSNTNVWLRPGEIELDVSLARFTAAKLILDHPASAQPPVAFDEENFNRYVPALKQVEENFFEITVAGKVLAPREVDVQLNEEGDGVDFTIIYARPPPGPLRIAVSYIKLLPDEGYGTALAVFDEAQHVIASDDNLNMEHRTLDLNIPPTAETPSPGPGPTVVPHN